MADQNRRIIVDGVEFSQLFHFPKLFRAIPLALQPPRLLVALFMVLILVAVGRVWDGVTPASISPAGIHAGLVTENELAVAQNAYRRALQEYAPEDRLPEGAVRDWPQLDAPRVLRDMRAGYRERRQAMRDEGVEIEQIRAEDARYLGRVAEVERVRPRRTFEATAQALIDGVNRLVLGVVAISPAEVGAAFGDVLIRTPAALWDNHPFFIAIYGLIFLFVAAVGGGAIARMTANEVAGHERLRARDALEFSMTSWPRLVLAPLLPLLVAGVVALLIVLLGVLTNVPVLNIIAGILYILALLLGFAVAFLLIVYVAALPMFIPAIACENCDAVDAQQRSYAYVISRPLHLLGYAIIAAVALALGFLLVSLFAWAILNITAGLFSAWTRSPAAEGAGGFMLFELFDRVPATIPGGLTNQVTAWFISLWQTLVLGLVAAFVLSFLFAAATILYLLMRRASDGQAMEEIWRPGLVPGTLARMPAPPQVAPAAPPVEEARAPEKVEPAEEGGEEEDERKAES